MCEPCFAAEREAADRASLERYGRRGPLGIFGEGHVCPGDDEYDPLSAWPLSPCPVCGRGVRGGQWTGCCCCDPCRVERENRARRVEHEPRVCAAEGCEVAFTPKRADAVYHSAACKQRAYRQRVTAARDASAPEHENAAESGNA